MADSHEEPLTILALASYFKGERFLQQAHRRGARVYLFTQARLLQKPWPRESLVDVFAQPEDSNIEHTLHTVSYLMRKIRFDRIVALDDFDVETAAAIREHLRIPGMGDTTARHFRDKLAMRQKAKDANLPSPEFVRVVNEEEIKSFIARVPAPWMLKPRSEASATGIVKVRDEAQLWSELEKKGDKASYCVLEQFLPGDVYHVDSLTADGEVVFAEVHRCSTPPFDVAHGGGIFATRTVERGSEDDKALRALNKQILAAFGLKRGASHTEFIKAHADGRFYLLETSARVGGAHIADVVEAATGVNLWAEWANIEIDYGKKPWTSPASRAEYGGVTLTLARQERPDLSSYGDPEVVMQVPEPNHAGLILRSSDAKRMDSLVNEYGERFMKDFNASMPAPEKSVH